MTRTVLLDTDIGTDVDDCLALALLLASPELELAGVTCVYGDVQLRARMVLRLLQLAGRSAVPVCAGAGQPLLGLHPLYWEGHEGQGLLDQADPPLLPAAQHAVDFLVETVLARPGAIDLLAIGPLTNVALAIRREPRFATALGSLVIMGGALRGLDGLHLPLAEHNIKCDPEAAYVVFGSGAPITLVPLDLTTTVRIDQAGLARIRAVGTTFHDALADQLARYPGFARRGWTYLHDPLAAAVLINRALVTAQPLHISVETAGRYTTGATIARAPTADLPANAQVGVACDAARAEAFVIGRLSEVLP